MLSLTLDHSSNLESRVSVSWWGYSMQIPYQYLIAVTVLWPTMEPLYIPSSPSHTLQNWGMAAPEEGKLGRENSFSPPSQISPIPTPFPALPPSSYSSAFLWQSAKADTVCRRSVEGFWIPSRWGAEGGGRTRGLQDYLGLWFPSWMMFIREQIQALPWDPTVWGTRRVVKGELPSPEPLGSIVSWYTATSWCFLRVPLS